MVKLQPWNEKTLAPWKESHDSSTETFLVNVILESITLKTCMLLDILLYTGQPSKTKNYQVLRLKTSVLYHFRLRISAPKCIVLGKPLLFLLQYLCILNRFSRVWLFVTLWTILVRQVPLSWGFSMQEYWSGLPCPPPVFLSISICKIAGKANFWNCFLFYCTIIIAVFSEIENSLVFQKYL